MLGKKFPSSLSHKLIDRESKSALRKLSVSPEGIDFFSNDYLGFARNGGLHAQALKVLESFPMNGSTGSRLISGNYALIEEMERDLASIIGVESCLSYSNGYLANIGFFSCVPQAGDVVLYDKLIHASVHDGLKMSKAKAIGFLHNDLNDLEQLLKEHAGKVVYVVTEGVFSMDGDIPPLPGMVELCERYGAYVIVDEAHSYGVIGEKGEGLVAHYGLQEKVFATLYTFGKAMGCHGAVWGCSNELRSYLVNFSRSFIYSTGIAPYQAASMWVSVQANTNASSARLCLRDNIHQYQKIAQVNGFLYSNTAIQVVPTSGNEQTDKLVEKLNANKFLVKGIKYPTVPPKSTRIRVCLHSFNSTEEIKSFFRIVEG